jgi:hypothetical protein
LVAGEASGGFAGSVNCFGGASVPASRTSQAQAAREDASPTVKLLNAQKIPLSDFHPQEKLI